MDPETADVVGDQAGAGESSASAPNRIRRNTACTSCRDSKVKCTANLSPKEPCVRCSRLKIPCVVDRSHKRMTRRSSVAGLDTRAKLLDMRGLSSQARGISGDSSSVHRAYPIKVCTSVDQMTVPGQQNPTLFRVRQLAKTCESKLEQLEKEVQSIRDAVSTRALPVEPSLPTASSPPMPSSHVPFSTFPDRPSIPVVSIPEQVPTPSQSTAYTTPTGPVKRPSEPRALLSRVFSGESIDHYFDHYFEHFHPYLPVVRTRDPDTCYKQGPILFWIIISVACRQYEKEEGVLDFLTETIPKELWNVLSVSPLTPPTINAVLLICTWPLPTIRFMVDTSPTYISLVANPCLLLGLHTGRGSHPQFCVGIRRMEISDEVARHTWAGYNIVAQRVATYNGIPSLATLFNQKVEKQNHRESPATDFLSYFGVLLEAQKFSNRVTKTVLACLEGSDGVPEATVRLLEDEYELIERTLCHSGSELDQFNLLVVRLEIQQYYLVPPPNHDRGSLKRNIIRAYHTARTLIDLALRLHTAQGFLRHVPHWVFRSLLDAANVIIFVLHSIYTTELDMATGELDVKKAIVCLRHTAVQDGDLSVRSANILEGFWTFRHRIPAVGVGMSKFPHRIGAVVTFDCLRRWRANLADAKKAQEQNGEVSEHSDGPNTTLASNEQLLQDFDWSTLVMDFDWTGNDASLLTF